MPPGRPKKNSRLPTDYVPESECQVSVGETLDGRDYLEFMMEMEKVRSDPLYFIKDVLGFPGPGPDNEERDMWPVQKQIIGDFYAHKYDPLLAPIKKLAIVAGQRCISEVVNILTLEYGSIKLSDLYTRFHDGYQIHVKNNLGWVPVDMAFYVGTKDSYKLTLENNNLIICSENHKFLVNNIWTEYKNIKIGDLVKCHDPTSDNFYYYSPVIKLEKLTPCKMYDLSVPEGNSYVANGILTHNSSKSILTGAIMAYEMVEVISWDAPAKHFGLASGKSGVGSKIAITCLCPSMDQAKDGVFSYMRMFIEGNEWFKLNFPDLVINTSIIEEPRKNFLAQVKAAKASTLAGYTNKCFVADEYDLFQDSLTLIDAEAVFTKLCNSTETFKRDGKIIALSSLQSQNGRMMAVYKQFKKQEKNRLARAYMYKTWEMNPTVTKEYLLETCEGDRARFHRDFANEPQMSSGLQFPEGIKLDQSITNVLTTDFTKLPIEIRHIPRVLSIDPAYKNDSFGVACGFKTFEKESGDPLLIIDGVTKFEKISSKESLILPSDIKNFIISAMQVLNVYAFVYDVHMYPEILQSVEYDLGLEPIKHIVLKEDYDRWRELQDDLSVTKLRVVYDSNLEAECNDLIIKAMPGGKARTDHTFSGSKDSSDTVANCIWFLMDENSDAYETMTPIGCSAICSGNSMEIYGDNDDFDDEQIYHDYI